MQTISRKQKSKEEAQESDAVKEMKRMVHKGSEALKAKMQGKLQEVPSFRVLGLYEVPSFAPRLHTTLFNVHLHTGGAHLTPPYSTCKNIPDPS